MTTTNVPLKRAIPCIRRKLAAGMTMEQAQREYEERRAEGLSHSNIERLDQMKWSQNQAQRDGIVSSVVREAAWHAAHIVFEAALTEEQRAAWDAEQHAADEAIRRAYERETERMCKRGYWRNDEPDDEIDVETPLSDAHREFRMAVMNYEEARMAEMTEAQRIARAAELIRSGLVH